MKKTYFFVNDEWYRKLPNKGVGYEYKETITQGVIDRISNLLEKEKEALKRFQIVKERHDDIEKCINIIKQNSEAVKITDEFQSVKEEVTKHFDAILEKLLACNRERIEIQYIPISEKIIIVLAAIKSFFVDAKEAFDLIYIYNNCPDQLTQKKKTLIKLVRQTLATALNNAEILIKNKEVYDIIKYFVPKSFKEGSPEYKQVEDELRYFEDNYEWYKKLYAFVKRAEKMVLQKNINIEFSTQNDRNDYSTISPGYKDLDKELNANNITIDKLKG